MANAKIESPDKPTRKHLQVERYLAFGFGVIFICAILSIAIYFPEPSSFQYKVFLVVLSLAAAGFATTIPGFLIIEINNYIKAGGAIAVFLVCYYSSPAYLSIVMESNDWKRQSVSYLASYPEGFRVNVTSEGNVNVLENSMKIFAKEITVSYPEALNGVKEEFIDKINVLLNCEEDTPQGRQLKYRMKSDSYEIDRWINAGDNLKLTNIDFEIAKTENVKLAECNLQFTVYAGNKENGTGFVWGAPTPGLFK